MTFPGFTAHAVAAGNPVPAETVAAEASTGMRASPGQLVVGETRAWRAISAAAGTAAAPAGAYPSASGADRNRAPAAPQIGPLCGTRRLASQHAGAVYRFKTDHMASDLRFTSSATQPGSTR